MSTQRKVFHCAVDDTALTTNISEIKKWTRNGAITLIVPLFTLERLHSLKHSPVQQIAINAHEAVKFLDRVTSGKDPIPIHKVALQGPQEQYDDWTEVEQFLLPEYEVEGQAEVKGKSDDSVVDTLPETQNLLAKLNFKKDGEADSLKSANSRHSRHVSVSSSATPSSKTSPEVTAAKLLKTSSVPSEVGLENGAGSSVNSKSHLSTAAPTILQPLLNSMVWRLHNTEDASEEMTTCMLISNDATVQSWAPKYGIMVKSINKLRQAIIYEDKELKNRLKFLEKAQPEKALVPEAAPTLKYEDSDEEVVVMKGRGRGQRGSIRGTRGRRPISNGSSFSAAPTPDVPSQPIDPDSFSRSTNVVKIAKDEDVTIPIPNTRPTQQNYRAVRGRGNFGGTPRGKGKLWVP